MTVAIVNYKMGNITSVVNSLRFLGIESSLVSDSSKLNDFDAIILPGVGAFAKAMEDLKSTGMDVALLEAAEKGKKIIGICLGMQLLFTKSYEFQECKGLNLVKGEVLPFSEKITLRIPHMGWNAISSQKVSFEENIGDYYFIHSFYCKPYDDNHILFKSNYGIEFCSGVKNKNVYGLQFHPEKSQKNGLKLLEKILKNG